MGDGAKEAMQHYDGEIERLIRRGVIDLETGLSFATNAGNLRLQLADLENKSPQQADTKHGSFGRATLDTELEITR